ncbi:hypothetical protein F5Y19DRAFT_22223 [Xylariaceae sp. FL1651]|nr:hypothetical protein F5Y19DRAFT_22223 [Xylariaceae sp. FL1651]
MKSSLSRTRATDCAQEFGQPTTSPEWANPPDRVGNIPHTSAFPPAVSLCRHVSSSTKTSLYPSRSNTIVEQKRSQASPALHLLPITLPLLTCTCLHNPTRPITQPSSQQLQPPCPLLALRTREDRRKRIGKSAPTGGPHIRNRGRKRKENTEQQKRQSQVGERMGWQGGGQPTLLFTERHDKKIKIYLPFTRQTTGIRQRTSKRGA